MPTKPEEEDPEGTLVEMLDRRYGEEGVVRETPIEREGRKSVQEIQREQV